MQQLYVVKQANRKVVHIQIEQPSRPSTPNNKSDSRRSFNRSRCNPFNKKLTRSTFYVLKEENNSSAISLKSTHRETDQSEQINKRKTSALTCYGSFTNSPIYAQIFTQPISKISKAETKVTHRRSYSQAGELYDKIKAYNQNLITKQFQVQQKNLHTPGKIRTIHSRNCSSNNTQEGRTQTNKKQALEVRVKAKPWQAKKKGFYLAYTSKKMKTENEKYTFRYCIDPWEIIDRDDPQY